MKNIWGHEEIICVSEHMEWCNIFHYQSL
jgi:hypothetical protein